MDTERDTALRQRLEEVLRSSETIAMPRETLLGAISHYMSTLSSPDLEQFVEIVTDTPHLWDTAAHQTSARSAIRIGIQGAVSRLLATPGPSRWWSLSRDPSSAWLDEIARVALEAKGRGRAHMLVALLSGGQGEMRSQWKSKQRTRVEDEAIMMLASAWARQDEDQPGPGTISLFCELSGVFHGDKLRALNLESMLRVVVTALFDSLQGFSLRQPEYPLTSPLLLSRTIGDLLEAMDGGDQAMRRQAKRSMLDLCTGTQEVIVRPPASVSDDPNSTESAREFDRQKTALFAFLVPTAITLDLLLAPSDPDQVIDTDGQRGPASPASIALEILYTFSRFAATLDETQGGLEGYHRVLHGTTDVLAKGGPSAVRLLFERAPGAYRASPAEARWWMELGENLVHEVDTWVANQVLRPMTDKCISEDSHHTAFTAAHSLRLAMLKVEADCLSEADLQAGRAVDSALSNAVEEYAQLMINQHLDTKLTHDQLRSAFPLVAGLASKVSTSTFENVMRTIQTGPARPHAPADPAYCHSRRIILIACATHVPIPRLRQYLDDIAADIRGAATHPASSSELANAAFKMVMQDLGDSARGIGMRWWAERRGDFQVEGRVPRARL